MAEIATCVRCGQWVHDPENGRVCAECKAEDLADEKREEIVPSVYGRPEVLGRGPGAERAQDVILVAVVRKGRCGGQDRSSNH